MIAPLTKFKDNQQVSGKDLNMIIDKLNRTVIQTVTGGRLVRTGSGAHIVWPAIQKGVVHRAKTQEAAQADLNISVKLLDADGNVTGDAFDAAFIDADGVTAANSALPRVATSKDILVTKIHGSWYVINPTLIKSSVCP